MKKFALVGAAGYIAPQHLKAIKETGNQLVAAYDPYDSVGVLDSYFPEAAFFVEFERFDRHIARLQRTGQQLDYVSVCSPNYLHDSHIRFGLRSGANVICEKPLVLNPRNAELLMELEQETGKKVNNILQLRLHPNIVKLKQKIDTASPGKIFELDLTYITSRGNWYYTGWKADLSKSGGIATNIGIHFFDMLCWIFGDVKKSIVHLHTHDRASGYLEFARARVKWFLSVNAETLPEAAREKNMRTYRLLAIDGDDVDFSEGFGNLHVQSYAEILRGNGFGIADALPALKLAYVIRNATPIGLNGAYHRLAELPLTVHPFLKD